jgi:monoamine oxidase
VTSTKSTGVTRRELIGAAAAAASALPLAARADAKPGPYDVIVIGAGFCGVTAARECAKAGLRTLILEARGRIGGRTHTVPWSGTATDLGGTWVHWTQPYIWAEIQRYGLPLVESSGAVARRMVVRRSDGDLVEIDAYAQSEALAGAIAQYMGASREMFPRPHQPFDTGLPEKFDGVNAAEPFARIADPLQRDIVDGYISTCVSNRAREGAWVEMVRWYALAGHNFTDLNDAAARYRFRDGTRALIDAMLADGKPQLRLGEAVASVHQDAAGATVTTVSGEEIGARCVVSTLPLNVLADVAWDPALDARKLEVSRQRHAGACVKVHVVIEGEQDVACIAPSESPLTWLFTDHAGHGKTHLIGFGPSAEALDIADPAQLTRAVRTLLPNANVLDSIGWVWTADPHARGTWCVLRPGQYGKYLAALQAPAGRVVFASADWANGWRGFMDGAIEQGLVAARRVRALLA